MSKREVYDVNVVANAGSVGSIVIVAEYTKALKLTCSNLRYIRKKVVGYSR